MMYKISITGEACYVYGEDNVPVLQIPFSTIKSILEQAIGTDITRLQAHDIDIARGDYRVIYEALVSNGRYIDAVLIHKSLNRTELDESMRVISGIRDALHKAGD